MPDREKVISWVEGLAEDDWRLFHSDSEVQNIAKAVLALLKEHETANLYKCPNCGTWVSAENVVRCKNCKHGYECEFDIKCENEGNPQMFGTRHKPDWFCADGKRKEGMCEQ